MVRMEKMERTGLMVYHLVEMEARLLVEMEGMQVEAVMVGMLTEGTEAQLMVATVVTVAMAGMEAQLLLERGVVLLVVMVELVEMEEMAEMQMEGMVD
jgi:hypothetical protein